MSRVVLRHLASCALLGALGCTTLESGSARIDTLESDAASDDITSEDAAVPDAGEVDAASFDAEVLPDASDDCLVEDGLGGLPCTRCPSDDLLGLENACSSARCEPFDNAQYITAWDADAGLPALPEREPAGDAGSDAATPPEPTGTPCAELIGTRTPVYATGSTAARPFFQLLGPQLAGQDIALVYLPTGSCSGVDALLNRRALYAGSPSQSALVWPDAGSSGETCALDGDVHADLGISDVFAQTCAGFELVDLDALHVRDALGPVQTMTFVVPATAQQTEISAEAAYMVYGFGADAGLVDRNGEPLWDDESLLLQRNASSGTQALLAAAIGLSPGAWRGKEHGSSDGIAQAIMAAASDPTSADDALGILSADYVQIRNLRAQIRPLAFQDAKQTCAMYPDSTLTARDKQNVRDGHYPLWGPLHLLHRIDAEGRPVGAGGNAVAQILGYLSGTMPLPNGVQLIDLYAESGLIPECAMHVKRTRDGGSIMRARPALPCSCLFELKATGRTTCETCRFQSDCDSGESCALGYCEPDLP